ncbi:helix-turn-helix domain-containing protein [Levilactobacillus brevis]|uniref:helix-turn-helix domain-containing protein n=1 Tax=Levilactobacillus brevis TaxID=1580 RepID=UPI0009B8CF34|nr:helix-turn-helix transcriptional regulator [Levilactobacillus brevis]
MTLFDRIKKIAKDRGYSIAEVERRAGVSTNYMYQWKKRNPNPETLASVAKVLNVSVDYLLSGEEQKNETTKKVNIEELLDGTAMLTDRDGELTDADRAALRALISTYLQSTEGRERLKKYSNMELDDNGGNGDD